MRGKGRLVIRKKSRDGIKRQEERREEGEVRLERCFKKLKERGVAQSLCQGVGEGNQLLRWVHGHTCTSVKLRPRHEMIPEMLQWLPCKSKTQMLPFILHCCRHQCTHTSGCALERGLPFGV